MRDLVIMPAMAQRRESLNMGEFAEEAIIVEEVAAPKRVNHFIEANTQEVTLHHLKHDCITPVFSKDNELTINHAALWKPYRMQHNHSLTVREWNRQIFV